MSKESKVFNGMYDVYNDGETIVKLSTGKRMTVNISKNNAKRVNLYYQQYHVGRLVHELFIGPIPDKHVIKFKDGDAMNCDVTNLTTEERSSLSSRTINKTKSKPQVMQKHNRLLCIETKEEFETTVQASKWLLSLNIAKTKNYKVIAAKLSSHLNDPAISTNEIYGYTFKFL